MLHVSSTVGPATDWVGYIDMTGGRESPRGVQGYGRKRVHACILRAVLAMIRIGITVH